MYLVYYNSAAHSTVDCQIKVTIGLAIYIYIPDQTPTIPNLFWYGIAINIPQ